jgi:limonene-1,2-epoxide hydrolase
VRALAVAAALVVAGCAGGDPSPESVVRAWSQAVNSGDDASAARLFATGARVVQGENVRRLDGFAEARAWNAALPCSGRIVELRASGATVRATFVLGDRRHVQCDGPGERAKTLFRIRDGKIVLWHQLDPALEPEEESV